MSKTKNDAATNEIQQTIDELNKTIQGKDTEIKKLYKLINLYKQQITNLEIEKVDNAVTIESLQEIIQIQKATTPSEADVEDMGNPERLQ